MKFRLLDKDGETQVHEGIAMRTKKPDAISWGHRVFIRDGEVTEPAALGGAVIVKYREVDAFRIGG